MMRALYSAASGMKAQQMNVDNISNNIANVNTTGFKRGRADFQDLLYEQIKIAGMQSEGGNETPVGIQMGHGVGVGSISKIFSQGVQKSTEQPTDFAIVGDGFFEVQLPDGSSAYTRAGDFHVDANRRLLTANGHSLVPEITLPDGYNPQTDPSVSPDGTVFVRNPDTGEVENAGNINLTSFVNPAGLEAIGDNLFLATQASGDPRTGTPGTEGLGIIRGGHLEFANVKIVDEMVDLIIAQRAYEVNSKSIQASDDMLQTANNVKR
jgi:flagellar basal-body rod protein FlgG